MIIASGAAANNPRRRASSERDRPGRGRGFFLDAAAFLAFGFPFFIRGEIFPFGVRSGPNFKREALVLRPIERYIPFIGYWGLAKT
jgi:hypothetical protein